MPLDVERALSPAFVRLPQVSYGTRCSTLVIAHQTGVIDFWEATWNEHGHLTGTVKERIG